MNERYPNFWKKIKKSDDSIKDIKTTFTNHENDVKKLTEVRDAINKVTEVAE